MNDAGQELGAAVGFRLHDPVTPARVGDRMRFLRDQVRGLSVRDMAIALQCTDAAYRGFEEGAREMTLSQLIRAACALDVAVAELVR